jgi:hypothetical protein
MVHVLIWDDDGHNELSYDIKGLVTPPKRVYGTPRPTLPGSLT